MENSQEIFDWVKLKLDHHKKQEGKHSKSGNFAQAASEQSKAAAYEELLINFNQK